MMILSPPTYIPKGWPRLYYTITNFMRRLDMRLARLLALFVLMAVCGLAQPPSGPFQIRISTVAVSGSCPSQFFLDYDYVHNNLYGCSGTIGSLTWQQISGGAGGGVTSFTGDSVVYNNSASTGAVTLSLIAQVKNLVFAGPASGANANPTFRALVGADLPNPSATTLGGIESIAAVTSKWINSISTSGVPSLSQPAFSDLTGSATCAQLPALTGDTTTSAGSCATTVGKVDGVTYPASPSVNTVPVVTSAAGGGTITYEAVPNNALANSSITFSNGTGISGGATVSLGGTYTPAVTANTRSRAIGASWDGGGSALVTTGSAAYFFVPFACTIVKWAGTVDTGTITWDVWKIASGTAIPTISNTITASALPAISTGTALASTSMSGWTTTVTAYDIFGFVIKTVASATKSSLILECDTSS